ncbi:MAG: glycosyltransferase family 39 protein [Nitrospirota bacterium]
MINYLKEEQANRVFLILLLSFVILYFYNLGMPSIWNPNEAFYAETPREMIEKKDYMTPYFNYEYRFQKPILTYWLVLPWCFLLGLKEMSVRMVSALSAAGGIFLVYWLGKSVWNNKRAGLISGILLAAAVDYNSLARYGSTDMLLTVLITLALVLFYKGYTDKNGQRLWYFMVYVACGFATLTKGPVGIIIPFLIIFTFLLIKKDIHGLKRFISVYGFLAFLLIASSWYIFMTYTYGNEFFSVLQRENIVRFTEKISGSTDPFYYVSVISWNFFPGSVFIIPASYWLFRNFRQQENIKFPVVWFLVVFIFFSIAKSKLPAYILSALPALSVIVGGWIDKACFSEAKGRKAILWLSPFILLAIFSATLWVKTFLPDINLYFIGIIAFLFLVSILSIKKKMYYLSLIISIAGMIVFNLIFLSDILPQVEKYRPYKEMAKQVKLIDPDKRLPFYCYEGYQQNLSFYMERKILRFKHKEELEELLKDRKKGFILFKKDTFEKTFGNSGWRIAWEGLFYKKSESMFMNFLMDIKKKNLEEYVIIHYTEGR